MIPKTNLKIFGVKIPGTAKPRRDKWKKIDHLPTWIKGRRPARTKLIQGKKYIYKITAQHTWDDSKFKTGMQSAASVTAACGKTTYRYYRRKRGFKEQ